MDQLSRAAIDLCISTTYLNQTFHIINSPKTLRNNSFGVASTWYDGTPNMSAVWPSEVNLSQGWVYHTATALSDRIPLSKPLLIDCPIHTCGFALSGWYCDLQRYLLYFYLAFSLAAIGIELWRGIAQIWLMTMGVTSFVHFITIVALQSKSINKFIDTDAMAAVFVISAGLAAMALWCSLRYATYATKVFSNRTILFAFYSSFLSLVCLLTIWIIFSTAYGFNTAGSAVLLESAESLWLTSSCYDNGAGEILPWSGVSDYPIRQPNDLLIIKTQLPSSGNADTFLKAVQASLYGLNIQVVKTGFSILAILTLIVWIVPCACVARKRNDTRPPPSERAIQNSFIFLVLFQSLPTCIGFLAFTVAYEVGVHRHHVSQNDASFHFDQWGTWILSVLVIIFVLFANLTGVDGLHFPRRDFSG